MGPNFKFTADSTAPLLVEATRVRRCLNELV